MVRAATSKPHVARFASGLGRKAVLSMISACRCKVSHLGFGGRPATNSCKTNLAKNRGLSIFTGHGPMSALKGSQKGVIIIII